MSLLPNSIINDILSCFGQHPPASIILGGSYASNEECIYTEGNEYWMSDYDLLCIDSVQYTQDEANSIYSNMLIFSKTLNQFNPYFHIGMKLRTPEELSLEKNQMYFKEIANIGMLLFGVNLEHNVGTGTQNEYFNKKGLYRILFKYGLTRLWCNILFFPIKLITECWKEGMLWYSYFISRGTLDWISWQLIENNIWANSYMNRYYLWLQNCNPAIDDVDFLKTCLDVKTGKCMRDVRDIFKPMNKLSNTHLLRYHEKAFCDNLETNEMHFIFYMMNIIESSIYSELSFDNLLKAKHSLEAITQTSLNIDYPLGWEYWHELRTLYSNLRFSRNPIDLRDHSVYTNHFISLGKP